MSPSDHDELSELAAALPERYQPLYGWSDQGASRPAGLDRTTKVVETLSAISDACGRTLRVLDLGSAQGYFSFLAAEGGHVVTGVDYLPQNIAVSRAIAGRHPSLDVRFVETTVEAFVRDVRPGDFDVVLGLSILHHIVHLSGVDEAARLVRSLASSVPFAIFEMALASEPVAWGSSQPTDPRVVLAGYPFVRRIGTSPTHLSGENRPLIYCSTSHMLVDGEVVEWESCATSSHPKAADVAVGKRRYFFSPELVVKVTARFTEDDQEDILDDMKDELRREAELLEAAALPDLPALVEFAEWDDEVFLARRTIEGVRVDLLPDLAERDRVEIHRQVVRQAAALEARGMYHHDLRTWNVLWDADARRAHLIDFGQIRDFPGDVQWPHSPAYSLLLFTLGLFSARTEDEVATPRRPFWEIDGLPDGAKAVARGLCSATTEEGIFARSLQLLETESVDAGPSSLAETWLFGLAAELTRQVQIERWATDVERQASLHNALMAEAFKGEAHNERQASLHNALMAEAFKAEADALRAQLEELQDPIRLLERGAAALARKTRVAVRSSMRRLRRR